MKLLQEAISALRCCPSNSLYSSPETVKLIFTDYGLLVLLDKHTVRQEFGSMFRTPFLVNSEKAIFFKPFHLIQVRWFKPYVLAADL